jgi:hypothetical protein
MRRRSRLRSRLVGIGVEGGEGEGSPTYHPPHRARPHHTTLPRPPPRHWPLDPGRRLDATDGQTAARKPGTPTLPPHAESRHVVQRATPRHLTIPLLFSSLLFSRTEPSAGKYSVGTEGPYRLPLRSHHINQPTNHSTNELYIQCIHCHIPSTHPSSAVQYCSHTPSM